MSTTDKKLGNQPCLRCLTVAAPAPWHAYLIPVEEFPTDQKSRPLLLKAVTELIASLRSTQALQRVVWLLLDELHHESAVTQISRNAAIWQPDIGLGVRPENPPPRFWTGDDLLERDHNTPFPPLKHTVVLLDTNEAGAELACGLMNGLGGLIQTLSRAPLTQVRDDWYAVLQPAITEQALAAYALYAPILGVKTVAVSPADSLTRWMGTVELYLRESAEDKGIFILSRDPLEPVIEHLQHLRFSDPPQPEHR